MTQPMETGPTVSHPDTGPNLTRDEAAERAALLAVRSYDIDIDLTGPDGGPSEKTFRSRVAVSFSAQAGAMTVLDFVGDGIIRAALNGQNLDIAGWSSNAGLAVPGLAAENELVVEAVGLYTNTGEGLHRFVDPEDGAVYLYTQFETADAKRLYPCFDQPDLKARFVVTVTAPADWVVVSNGAEVSDDPVDVVGVDEDRRPRRRSFATTEPMSTYVTALVAGPYYVVADSHDGIDLRLFCRRNLAEHLDAERLFTQTKQGFDFYHEAFGVRYPFGKYDQLFVPEFNAGAMENAGAVTFREEYVFRSKVTRFYYERRCETLLHEMAHMWFGDLVTMRWWDDLWLNESFATWASVVAQVNATEYTAAWTTFANAEKSWAYVQDQLPSTHPIAADIADLEAVKVNFDGITYAKGASVLKQLAAYVGYSEFLAGLRTYFAAHAFGNATLADLLEALEQSSGRDLGAWSAAWLRTTGLNPLSAELLTDDAGIITELTVVQGPAAPGAGELRPHRLAIGVYDDDGTGALVRVHRSEIDVSGARTDVPELVGAPRGRLVLVNDDDLSYGKVRLDPVSLATAVDRVGDISESLPRTLVWSALWEMTRDAELPARQLVSAVLHGISAETEIGVVQRLLAQVTLALTSYADPGWSETVGWPSLVEALTGLATSAPAGSDLQLAAVNSLCGARLGRDHLELLRSWRDESAPLRGLVVDEDLSWSLLGALVAHGAAGRADIDAAATADATASGQRRAATVRALLPEPEAKRDTWERLMIDDGMANAIQDATIAGFSHPAQLPLLEPFVSRYFGTVDEVWSRRSVEMAQKVVVGLYPRWAVAPETVAQARSWEEAGDRPAALRRLISEGRAGTERALRARAADH